MRARAVAHLCLATLGVLAGFAPQAAGAPAHGRAWELVTSQDTLGVQPQPARAWSPDGDRVAYFSFGPMPGASSGEVLAHSVAVRRPSGWESQPIGQPFTVSSGQIIGNLALAVSRDLSTWLWGSINPLLPGAPPGASSIYRRAPDGSLTLLGDIGSLEPAALLSFPAVSDDLEHAAWESSEPLLPADTGRIAGRAVYEFAGSTMRLAGVDSAGAPLSPCGSALGDGLFGPAPPNAISRDGSRIFLTSPDPHIFACPEPKGVYLREDGATTTEVSASQCTRPDCGPAADVRFAGALLDGSSAFLLTTGQLTDDDTDTAADLYRYDVISDALSRLSGGPPGVNAAVTPAIRFSADGDRVYFTAPGTLVPGEGVDGGANLYVRTPDETRFIATLAGGESLSSAAVSANGVLLFSTQAPLLASDLDTAADLYRYDAASDSLQQVSLGEHGEGNGPFAASIPGGGEFGPFAGHDSHPLTEDGSRVFLQTVEALVPTDVNAERDIYEWSDGSLGLISNGAGTDNAVTFAGASADGRSVFFISTEGILPEDDDGGDADIYVARLGGGFPRAEPPPPCEGDACQGPPPQPLLRPAADSASARATGDRRLREGTFALGRIGTEARRALIKTGETEIALRVPAPGRVHLLGVAAIDGHRQVVARRSAIAWREGRITLRLRLSAAARRALDSPGGALRLRLTARYSRSPQTLVTILDLRRPR